MSRYETTYIGNTHTDKYIVVIDSLTDSRSHTYILNVYPTRYNNTRHFEMKQKVSCKVPTRNRLGRLPIIPLLSICTRKVVIQQYSCNFIFLR